MGRLDPVVRFANAVKALGCGVLIDGFGRRAASFTPLKVLRADFVKVDGSVVRKLLTSEVARTKMNAIQRFAEALRMGVIAECVESCDILAHLKTLKVSHAQGFGVHPPRPMEEVAPGEPSTPMRTAAAAAFARFAKGAEAAFFAEAARTGSRGSDTPSVEASVKAVPDQVTGTGRRRSSRAGWECRPLPTGNPTSPA